ncbi:tetratricopeptide repeat protein [Planctomicrobium sp. SH664]|uniref:tetratricopeptide repeat protein n=1 Tax=Planctomicrobium sp. SH664 TaxID=3448125 RepID=UPI003F5CA4B9
MKLPKCPGLICGLSACLWLGGLAPHVADGNETPPPTAKPSRLQGLQIQPGDEPLQTFQPRESEAANSANKKEALARYMTGRVLQERGDFDAALKAYQAAIGIDPTAIDAYSSALAILLQKGKVEEARTLAMSAAENNEAGFQLILAMSEIFVRQDQMNKSIQLLQDALASKGLKPGSVYELFLHRDLGALYGHANNPQKAAEEYRIVFDAVTGDTLPEEVRKKVLADPGKLFDEFGDAFLKASQPELALKAFAEASKYREAKPGLHSYNLATVFRQTGNSAKALEELQGYFDAQLQSRGRLAYELLKDLLKESGQESELIPRLEKMQEKDTHNDVLRYFLADELLAAGQLDRAAALYTHGRSNVTDPRALIGMLSIHRQQKNYEKLLTVLTKSFQTIPRGEGAAVQQLPPDIRVIAEGFERELAALLGDEATFTGLLNLARAQKTGDDAKLEFAQAYLLGKLSIEAERTAEAIEFYRLAISMKNDPPSALYRELTQYLLFDTEQYAEAQSILEEAIKHESNSLQRDKWLFLSYLSQAQELQGHTDEAVQSIQSAQQLNPSLPNLQFQEGWIYYHAHRWDDALKAFNDVIRDYASDREMVQRCRFMVSSIYVEKGDLPKGEEVLEAVLKEDPDNIQANNDLGYLWADNNKNLERARSMIQKALSKEPENPAYLDSMGWVLYRLGDFKGAVEYLEKAVSHDKGKDSTIYDHLGDSLLKLDRQKEAVEFWKKSLEIEEKKKNPSEKLQKSLKEKLKEA